MATEQEIRIKLITEAQSLIAGLKQGETATEKLRLAIISLEAANKQVASAEEKLEKARASGNDKAIKQAEKQLETKAKIAIQAEKDVEKQVALVQRSIAQEEKASEKVQILAEKEVASRQRAEEKKQQSIQKTIDVQQKALTNIAKAANETFEKLATGGNPLEALSGGIESILKLTPGLGQAGEVLEKFLKGGIQLVSTFSEITKEAIESQKQIDQLTTTTGVSATNISALRVAADQIGQSFVQVVGAIDKFAEKIKGAEEGVRKDQFIFEKLNVSLKDASGNQRSLNDLLEESIRKFGQLEAGTDKAAIGYRAFGLRAQKVIDQLAPQFDQLREKIEDSGIVLSKIDADKLRKLSLDLVDIQTKFTGLRNIIGADFADAFSDIAKNATQAFKAFREDPDLKRGLEVVLDVVEKLVQVLGNTLVDVVKNAAKVIAGFGNTLDLLPDSAKKLLGITPELVKGLQQTGKSAQDAALANQALVGSQAEVGDSTDALTEKLKSLNKEQQIQAKLAESRAKSELAALENLFAQGLLSEQEFAQKRGKINEDLAALKFNNALQESKLVQDSISNKEKALDQEFNNAVKNQQLKQQLFDQTKAKFLKLEGDKFKEALLIEEDYGKKVDEESKNRITIANQEYFQLITNNRNALNQIKQDLESASAQVIEVEEKKAKFQDATNLKKVVDLRNLSEEEIRLREALAKSVERLTESEAGVSKAIQETKTNILKAELSKQKTELTKSINEAKEQSEKTIESITATGIEAARQRANAIRKPLEVEKRGLEEILQIAAITAKDREEIEKRLSAVKAELAKKEKEEAKSVAEAQKKADQERAINLENSIKERNALTKAANEEEKQAIEELAQAFVKGQLSKEEALRKAFLLELELTEKSLANQKSNLSDLTTQKSLGKDVDDKIIAANEEITKLQREQLALQQALKGEIDNTSEAVNKVANRFKDVDSSASKSKDSIKENEKSVDDLNSAIQKTAGKILSIKQNFDASKASVEELKQQIIDLRADADSIRFSATLAFPGKDAVVKSFEEAAEAIEKILAEKLTKEQLERFKEQQEKELAERRRAAQEAIEIAKNLEKEIQQTKQETKEARKKINEEILENAKNLKDDLVDLAKKQKEQLDDFDQEQKDRELERADQQNDALLQKQLNFQAKLQGVKDAAEQESAQKQSEAANKAAQIDSELQDLLNKKQQEQDPNKRKELDEQIKKKQEELNKADKAEEDRVKREQRKQDEITKAQKEAQEKIKGAKSNDEVEEIEKALEIQLDGIDKKFKNEQKFADELARFQGKVSQERLDALKAAFERQQAAIETNTKNRLDAEKRQTQLSEEIRKKAAEKEKAEIAERRQTLIDSQKKELEDRVKAFNDKQKQLEEALKNERQEYKKHIVELQTKTAESLAEISKSFADGGSAAEKFFIDFAKNAGLTGKAIDDILKKLKQFKDEVANDSQQINSATGSSTSPANPSSTNTNGQNSGNGVVSNPTPSSNNGVGTIGNNSSSSPTPSTNTTPNGQTIVQQPKEERSGKGKPGIPTPSKVENTQPGLTTANDANDFKKNIFAAREKFFSSADFNKGGLVKSTPKSFKAQEEFTNSVKDLIKNYMSTAKLDISKDLVTEVNNVFITKQNPNPKPFAQAVDALIEAVENSKAKSKLPSDAGKIIDVTPTDPSNPGSLGGNQTPGDKGNDGFGDKDKPKIPPEAPASRGRDNTDKEKAFTANRAKDTENGDGEGAEKKGFVRVEPDAAVKGNPNPNPTSSSQNAPGASPQASSSTTNKETASNTPNSPIESTQPPTQISQTNNNEVTINLYSQGFLGDNKTVNQLKALFSDLMSQQNEVNQDRLRNLNGASLARRG